MPFEIVHLEVGRTADIAAQHGLAVGRLVVLKLRALRPQHAKAVAPAQRHLHHTDRHRVGRNLLIDCRNARIRQRSGNGEVFEDDKER